MKIYRGPASKPLYDDTHELVSTVTPDELFEGVAKRSAIKFNISKDALDRRAVCHAVFEEADFLPMIDALVERLKVQQRCLADIRAELSKANVLPQKRLDHIGALVHSVR